MNEGAFLQDLALVMAAAGLVAISFAKLKWPKVVGYILAGVALSRYTWGGGFLADEDSVRTLGQLGVVFLMFTMGLDFSASQIKRLRNVAVPTALLDVTVMVWLGYTIGSRLFGWNAVASLFLGAAICDSATTMLAKVVDEMKWTDRPFVKCALGTSVCEDIVCVGVVALATGVAQGRGLSLAGAGVSLGGLSLFFTVTIVAGFVLVPRLLKSIAKTGDGEALMLAILGCCFLVSWVAFKFDFSLALGAFLVGMLGASSDVRHRLVELAEPLKWMFAAVFFVSIGLLVDPAVCMHHAFEILAVSAVVVAGKFVNCTVGALFAGERVKTAVQIGMSLAQIGEFAFMVGMLYVAATGDMASPMYNIVVAASLLTTLLNPLMIRMSEPVGEWVEARLPARVVAALETYRRFVEKYHGSRREVRLHRVVRMRIMQLGVIAMLNFAAAAASTVLVMRDWSGMSPFFDTHKRFVFCLATNLFVVSMLAPAVRIAKALGGALALILTGAGEAAWQQSARHFVTVVVRLAVLALLFGEMVMININLVPPEPWARWTIDCVLVLTAVAGWRFFQKASRRAARRFEEALGADERREKIGAMLTFTVPEGAIHQLVLGPDSPAAGASVVTLDIRAKTGASVVSLRRGKEMIRNVGPETEFRPGDVLFVMGDGAQVAALKDLLGVTV